MHSIWFNCFQNKKIWAISIWKSTSIQLVFRIHWMLNYAEWSKIIDSEMLLQRKWNSKHFWKWRTSTNVYCAWFSILIFRYNCHWCRTNAITKRTKKEPTNSKQKKKSLQFLAEDTQLWNIEMCLKCVCIHNFSVSFTMNFGFITFFFSERS